MIICIVLITKQLIVCRFDSVRRTYALLDWLEMWLILKSINTIAVEFGNACTDPPQSEQLKLNKSESIDI